METEFDILQGMQVIGKAKVTRQGLYYHFRCKCSLSGDVLYKLIVSCGNASESLGVCVPVDGAFGLETRLPVKRLGEGEMRFRAVQKHRELTGMFVPIVPEEPFLYIDKLCRAYYTVREGKRGVMLPNEYDPEEEYDPYSSSPTGQ